MAWYFAFATVLSSGEVMVDAMRVANEEQCRFEVARMKASAIDVSVSIVKRPPPTRWRQFWSGFMSAADPRWGPTETVRAPYTLVSECAQFRNPPTVIISGDRRSLRMVQ